jgi:purine nucleosidase
MLLPIVLDTDIGTDIDDAYALILAAVSPEVDLRAVTTVNYDVCLRARIAKALLKLIGRSKVAVSAGACRSLTPGETRGWGGHEGRGINLTGIHFCQEPDFETAPAVIASAAVHARQEGSSLILVTIGAMTNAALALERYPAEMKQLGRIVAMASNFKGFGMENASGEHNVACDPDAVQRVLASGIQVTLIGLNVTRKTSLNLEQVDHIAAIGGPLADALVGMHRIWFEHIGQNSSPMHDALALVYAFRPDLFTTQAVTARVLHDAATPGTILFNPAEEGEVTVNVATAVDLEGFEELFWGRILGAVKSRRT